MDTIAVLLVAVKLVLNSTCVDTSTLLACNWQAKAPTLALLAAMALGELGNSIQAHSLAKSLLPEKARLIQVVCPSKRKLMAAWLQLLAEAGTLCKAQHVLIDQRAGAVCLGPTCVHEVKPLGEH